MNAWILIIVITTSGYGEAGVSSVSAEFSSKENCIAAGKTITADAAYHPRSKQTYGCFPK